MRVFLKGKSVSLECVLDVGLRNLNVSLLMLLPSHWVGKGRGDHDLAFIVRVVEEVSHHNTVDSHDLFLVRVIVVEPGSN